MKKIMGIICGFFFFVFVVCCWQHSLDCHFAQLDKDFLRDYRINSRQQSVQINKSLIDENTLVIFGSSELVSVSSVSDSRPYNILNSPDINVITIGQGHRQSLYHTIMLGALADSIQSNKVAIFISPQWFDEDGISDSFASVMSEDALIGFLYNDNVSEDIKDYVLERCKEILCNNPTMLKHVQIIEKGYNSAGLYRIYTILLNQYWNTKYKLTTYKGAKKDIRTVPCNNLENLDWEEMLKYAEQLGKQECTNNDFGINNNYWEQINQTIYDKGEVLRKKQTYVVSPEYDDLRCFLKLADELNIETYVVSIPVNKKWYYYQGELCDVYYENIRNLVSEFDNPCIQLIDMTCYDDEKYFLMDIMHLGWKGWIRIDEELYKRFTR